MLFIFIIPKNHPKILPAALIVRVDVVDFVMVFRTTSTSACKYDLKRSFSPKG